MNENEYNNLCEGLENLKVYAEKDNSGLIMYSDVRVLIDEVRELSKKRKREAYSKLQETIQKEGTQENMY